MNNLKPRINRLPKSSGSGTFKSSEPALAYAEGVLSTLHTEEIWTLAERLDKVMEVETERFIKEIRK